MGNRTRKYCFLITYGKPGPMGLGSTTSKQKILYILVFFQQLHLIIKKALSELLFANIFSHFVGYLFIVLPASFAVQKLFSWIQSHSFIFAFTSLAFEVKIHQMFKMLPFATA